MSGVENSGTRDEYEQTLTLPDDGVEYRPDEDMEYRPGDEMSSSVKEKADNLSVHSNTPIPIPSPDEISLVRELLFIFFMALAQLFTQAGVSQTINPGSEIAETFNVQDKPGEISWFSASYSLTVGTFILVSGRLGDMYGYKLIYIIGFIWYGVFSLLCGFSGFTSSAVFFDIMRSLQGVGPALVMPNATALIGHYYPPGRKKNWAMCCFGAVAPSGFCFGAIFSGIFTQLVWWPWFFWVHGIVNFIVALMAFFIIPKRIGSRSVKLFDWIGSVTGVSALILINFAFNQGPNVGWDKVYVYVLLIVGFLLIVLFYLSIKKVSTPIVSPDAFRGETGAILGTIAAGWSSFGIWLQYSFEWSKYVDGRKPIMRAVEFIPTAFVGFLAAALTAFLLTRVPSSVVMLMAMVSFLGGIVIMGTRHVGQIYWGQKFVSLLVQCWGMDMSFPAACIILSNSLPRHQQGIAGSLVSTFVNYSISIGLGFAGTVEYYETKNKPVNEETRIYGMRRAFYMGMGLAGLGVVLSLLFLYKQIVLEPRKNRKAEQETQNFDDKLENEA